MGFVDIHHHIAYGVDDGPASCEEMQAMLRRAARNDVDTIVATSHLSPGIRPFDDALYRAHLSEARAYCAEKQLGIEILSGAEILFDPAFTRQFLMDDLPTLGNTRCVLIEFPPLVRFEEMRSTLRAVCALGYVPVLAHIERFSCLVRKPGRVYSLKDDYPVLLQMNTSAFLEDRTMLLRMFARRLLGDEMIDFVATDAHNTDSRPCNMRAAHGYLAEHFGREYADELTGRGGKSALFEYA